MGGIFQLSLLKLTLSLRRMDRERVGSLVSDTHSFARSLSLSLNQTCTHIFSNTHTHTHTSQQVTYADLEIYHLFSHMLAHDQTALERYPHVTQLYHSVQQLPHISQWVRERPNDAI